tara:strand:+ start:71 stop:322 length:252 start_codon:yes stop_codon:yes gene_type:complete
MGRYVTRITPTELIVHTADMDVARDVYAKLGIELKLDTGVLVCEGRISRRMVSQLAAYMKEREEEQGRKVEFIDTDEGPDKYR